MALNMFASIKIVCIVQNNHRIQNIRFKIACKIQKIIQLRFKKCPLAFKKLHFNKYYARVKIFVHEI
jgi:hypothetical protein